MDEQRLLEVGREGPAGGVELLQQRAGEGRDVLPAIAQRRKSHDPLRQAGVEVGAEESLPDQRDEFPVARGDHAHVDGHVPWAPHRTNLPRLEHPEQRRLQRDRDVSRLVEEERAPVGGAEEPLLLARPRP